VIGHMKRHAVGAYYEDYCVALDSMSVVAVAH
jgi:hypothetical protein